MGADSYEGILEPGCRVMLCGLEKNPELNFAHADIVNYDNSCKRHTVSVVGGKGAPRQVSVKRKNLQPLREMAAWTAWTAL